MSQKISLFDGKKPGQAAAAGVTLGMCIHTTLAMLGLSAIVASSAVLFSAIKYIGAIYLFYVGITELSKSLKGKKISSKPGTQEEIIKKNKCRKASDTLFLCRIFNECVKSQSYFVFYGLVPAVY